MNGLEIFAFIITPIVAGLFVWGVARYGMWDLNRSRRARLNAQIRQG